MFTNSILNSLDYLKLSLIINMLSLKLFIFENLKTNLLKLDIKFPSEHFFYYSNLKIHFFQYNAGLCVKKTKKA